MYYKPQSIEWLMDLGQNFKNALFKPALKIFIKILKLKI